MDRVAGCYVLKLQQLRAKMETKNTPNRSALLKDMLQL
jgi:hypothetical protein